MKKEVMLFLGLSAISFIAFEVGVMKTREFNYLVYQELGIDIPYLLFDFCLAILAGAGITAVVTYFTTQKDKERDMGDLQANDLIGFFGIARDKYASLNLQNEAAQCDLTIALVQRIFLDPRLEPYVPAQEEK